MEGPKGLAASYRLNLIALGTPVIPPRNATATPRPRHAAPTYFLFTLEGLDRLDGTAISALPVSALDQEEDWRGEDRTRSRSQGGTQGAT